MSTESFHSFLRHHPLICYQSTGWFLSRLPNPSAVMIDSRQTVPGWSGFNAVASNQKIPLRMRLIFPAHKCFTDRAVHSLYVTEEVS